MKHMMKAMGQNAMGDFKPILEINPNHEIIQKLKEIKDKETIQDISLLLYEQAILIEGEEIKNPTEFARRLNKVMARSL